MQFSLNNTPQKLLDEAKMLGYMAFQKGTGHCTTAEQDLELLELIKGYELKVRQELIREYVSSYKNAEWVASNIIYS